MARLERGRAALGIGLWIGAGRREQRVELGVVDPAIAKRDAVQVARNRDHRALTGLRIERGDEHRVGQVLVATWREVDPDQQHGDALAEPEVRLIGRSGDVDPPICLPAESASALE